MPQPYELWWSVVPGPSQLVEQLTAHLVRFESALIPYTTASFPWGEEFRLSAYDRVRQVHPNLTEELCDASTMGERSPGRWVLDVVGRGEVFCLPSDDPIEIAAESGLLKQRIFWVTHFTSKAQVAEWVAFAKALRKKAADHCCCVVLLLPTSLRINSHLPELETDAFFGEYDLRVFASFLLSLRKLSQCEKKYLSELASALSFGDAVQCAELASIGKELLEEPEQLPMLRAIPNHLHGIWLAQIRTVFSHIEETKFAIVQQHRSAIAALLHTTDDFGIAIEQMEDIELRHLIHAVNHNIISLPERTCAVINALYNSRNQLAHHRILPYSELKQLHQQLL